MSCSTSHLGCLIYYSCKSFLIMATAYPCRKEFFKDSVKITYFSWPGPAGPSSGIVSWGGGPRMEEIKKRRKLRSRDFSWPDVSCQVSLIRIVTHYILLARWKWDRVRRKLAKHCCTKKREDIARTSSLGTASHNSLRESNQISRNWTLTP